MGMLLLTASSLYLPMHVYVTLMFSLFFWNSSMVVAWSLKPFSGWSRILMPAKFLSGLSSLRMRTGLRVTWSIVLQRGRYPWWFVLVVTILLLNSLANTHSMCVGRTCMVFCEAENKNRRKLFPCSTENELSFFGVRKRKWVAFDENRFPQHHYHIRELPPPLNYNHHPATHHCSCCHQLPSLP